MGYFNSKKGKVQLIGFGTFEARERAARTGKNPQTEKPIKIPDAKCGRVGRFCTKDEKTD